jgi:hypothetical protein
MKKPVPSRPRPTAMPVKPTMGVEKKAVPGVPTPNKNLPTPRTAQAPAAKAAASSASAKKEALKRMLPKKGK